MRRNDRILLNHFAKATDEIRNFIKGMDFSEFVENARTRKAAAFNDATTGDILIRANSAGVRESVNSSIGSRAVASSCAGGIPVVFASEGSGTLDAQLPQARQSTPL